MNYTLMITILAFSVFILLLFIGIYMEAKSFNNGICPRCKHKLKYFDSDSQGGRGYTCNNCNYTTFVSYKCVDRNMIRRNKK